MFPWSTEHSDLCDWPWASPQYQVRGICFPKGTVTRIECVWPHNKSTCTFISSSHPRRYSCSQDMVAKAVSQSFLTDWECANPFLFINNCFDTKKFLCKDGQKVLVDFQEMRESWMLPQKSSWAAHFLLSFSRLVFPWDVQLSNLSCWFLWHLGLFTLTPLSLASPSSQSVSHRVICFACSGTEATVGADAWALAPSSGLTKDPNSRLLSHTAPCQLGRDGNLWLPSTGWLCHLFHHFSTLCALTLRTVSNYSVRY